MRSATYILSLAVFLAWGCETSRQAVTPSSPAAEEDGFGASREATGFGADGSQTVDANSAPHVQKTGGYRTDGAQGQGGGIPVWEYAVLSMAGDLEGRTGVGTATTTGGFYYQRLTTSLNNWGAEGWEIAHIEADLVIMKRLKPGW